MAILYMGRDVALDRDVVVKVVHSSLSCRPEALLRFEREAQTVAKINHPNVVSVYTFGKMNGKQPYLVMEFIKGKPLSGMLAQQGPPPLPWAAKIVTQMCMGLEEAHHFGIIHRDLKPDNILLQEKRDRPDWVKIVDFGIAHLLDTNAHKRLTRMGMITGTPGYMSPEQFSDKQLDKRADIYSLGVVIFEMLAGETPFQSNDWGVLMAKHLMEPAPSITKFNPSIKEGSKWEKLVAKCLEKDPANRFQEVAELRKAVEEAALEASSGSTPVEPKPGKPGGSKNKPTKNKLKAVDGKPKSGEVAGSPDREDS